MIYNMCSFGERSIDSAESPSSVPAKIPGNFSRIPGNLENFLEQLERRRGKKFNFKEAFFPILIIIEVGKIKNGKNCAVTFTIFEKSKNRRRVAKMVSFGRLKYQHNIMQGCECLKTTVRWCFSGKCKKSKNVYPILEHFRDTYHSIKNQNYTLNESTKKPVVAFGKNIFLT